jgi:hypothetical protein
MVESKRLSRLGLIWLVAVAFGVLGVIGCARTSGGGRSVDHPRQPTAQQPWEWWRDLGTLASIPVGGRTVMRSSTCPSGCEFDRHSEGDSRFLRVRGDGEGVIFSTEGAGAVTRIWMVMGDGISRPLDGTIRIRVRIDGRRRPVVDLPLNELFAGTTPPFLAPMVADLTVSGGGNVSYVPIPFRDGCEITLVGAERAKIWFQVTARLVDAGGAVRSFSPDASLDGLRSMLERAGGDPWPGATSPPASGSVVLAPGEGHLIATLEGPDLINGIIIRTQRKHWSRLGLRFTFDDREPQLIPVVDLFGRPGSDGGVTRSLLVGGDADGDLTCYFPMPFFENAKVELLRRPVEGPARVKVEYALRTAGVPPPDDAGYFGVQIRRHEASVPGTKLTMVELAGRGKLVGLVADLRPSNGKDWVFLEGDEEIFVNGEETPSWRGTGVEDFFNGGFYFRDRHGRPAPFTTALAGMPNVRMSTAAVVMYRLLLGDAIVFQDGLRAELETGPAGWVSVRGRTVAYYYAARESRGDAAEGH